MEALSVVADKNEKHDDYSSSDLKIKSMLYLIECFERVHNEESLNAKVNIN